MSKRKAIAVDNYGSKEVFKFKSHDLRGCYGLVDYYADQKIEFDSIRQVRANNKTLSEMFDALSEYYMAMYGNGAMGGDWATMVSRDSTYFLPERDDNVPDDEIWIVPLTTTFIYGVTKDE
ncbi:MAG: hypothetical protein PHX74_04655 [Candidatus Sumerlaeales bacterium]|nr:hypothetical protein [Candidatus Sumerlaeales bacterium]